MFSGSRKLLRLYNFAFFVFICRDIRTHDNAKQEWTDDELKRLYETHEKLLDYVSLFCYVPRAKYLPMGPIRWAFYFLIVQN